MRKAGGNQVKKVMSALAVSAMLMSALPTSVMDAAARISIYINGTEVPAVQAPVMKAGRVLVPLRSIFEGIDAEVQFNNKTKTITATRGDQEVKLTLGSKAAYIDGQLNVLDVPASTIKGSTMVPIRFVSEAFGEKVFWNSRSQRVDIKTTSSTPEPPVDDTQFSAWNIYGSVSGSNGDGRDLTVSFTRAKSERTVSAYRVMLVKSGDINSFKESVATAVSPANYTSITPNGTNPKLTLNAQTRDVNGDLLNSNESYRLYVLTVGNSNNNNQNYLGWSSQILKLNQVKPSVQAVTGLRIADVSDNGDGRDLEINFTQPSTNSNITSYRAFVVKAKDASSFNQAAASKVSSANYTIINKGNSSTVKSILNSSSRDTSGELIKNGTTYVVYIMSVSANTATDSKLSAASSSLTLSLNSTPAPVITQVRDISDYGDGRDIQVSFNRVSDESKVTNYRVFVVRNSVASSFNLPTASNLSSSLYYTVNKTGNNLVVTLPSNMRDTSGYNITNLQDYRIFVMAAGTQQNNYTHALSASSNVLRLTSNSNAGVATNLSVTDIADNGNGSDMRVSFSKASDESNVSHYRVFVVPANNVGSFNLNAANVSNNYTQVNKTGGNLTVTLSSNSVDTNGYRIANYNAYRVFVLSVNSNGNWSQNALSSSSAQITLAPNAMVAAPTSVSATDVADNGNGSDLRVTFNRSTDENNVNHYRVFVVKNTAVGSFNLNAALNNGFYTYRSKSGSNQAFTLASDARATDGSFIGDNVDYRVFVLAVNNNSSQSSALSSVSPVVKLGSASPVIAVGSVSVAVKNQGQQAGNASDVTVNFAKASNETGIAKYRLFIVPADQVPGFTLNTAMNINYYNDLDKSSAGTTFALSDGYRDINNKSIEIGKKYRVFIMSVSDSTTRSSSLSVASDEFSINNIVQSVQAAVITGLQKSSTVTEAIYKLTFIKPSSETGISSYQLYIVKGRGAVDPATANSSSNYSVGDPKAVEVTLNTNAKDTTGASLVEGEEYTVYIVSVASNTTTNRSTISNPSEAFKLEKAPAVTQSTPPQ
ncbi:copper amine oxidase N-terminal domain-containing protein [Paenibacillus cucumis (ex Kampfer et al. 2016)]|uniref:Copper amine oxidase N-terminal domain-containing protein n=1 Tax=Paenibacillus cucumis (ex Kampfer et al. 2016) TaxID=1776858 RepID=A0ABS7KHM8_9BACL|nr:copper amine oxidase N-terminal domain-containing protein [Paenibacillus cucumis (ex Kampfer et al. 2016)]MBY0203642.1 copper amine oxidase N-terminal domain-containing protein [Paenibacillus cucumis (ex Kampfer et al. 2016)]